MIPLARYFEPHLAELLAQLAVDSRVSPTGGALACDVITLVDAASAQASLASYHSARWGRPQGQSGPSEIRLSDLGELVGALLLHAHGLHVPGSIYPLTFTSPGPTAQPAGIDVLGIHIDAGEGPLAAHERLSIAEAKSTLDSDASNAIGGIQADVKKCTAERVADSLSVLQWEYQRVGDPNHLRIHSFVTANCALYGSIVIDPLICDLDKTVASVFRRLEGKVTVPGAPLSRVFLLALPDARQFIEDTL